MRGQLIVGFNRIRELYKNRLTAARAENLDKIDATVTSRLSETDALTRHNTLIDEINKSGGYRYEFITESKTFIVPNTKILHVTAIAGGAGAKSIHNAATSGGSGAYAKNFQIEVSESDTLQVVVGKGGVANGTGTTGNGGDVSIGDRLILAGGVAASDAGQMALGGVGASVLVKSINAGTDKTLFLRDDVSVYAGADSAPTTSLRKFTPVGGIIFGGRLYGHGGYGGKEGSSSTFYAYPGGDGFVFLEWQVGG